MNRKLLIVIDMQKDFVTGAFGTKYAKKIVPKVVEKIKNWEGTVRFTRDIHYNNNYIENNLQSIESQRYPKHCIFETSGSKIIPELEDFITDRTYIKHTFAFDWSKIDLSSYDEIEIVGLTTDVCIISNALMLRSLRPYIKIVVDASCCAGTTKEAHENALKVMENCCIDVINKEE